jgi:AraC-like DNA-binding protein
MSIADLHQVLMRGANFERHAHPEPYAALLLDGRYEEAGEAGRWQVGSGEVLVHAAFAVHHNRGLSGRALILNLPLPVNATDRSAHFFVRDPDALARVAEHDPVAAAELLWEQLIPGRAAASDASDLLAMQLSGANSLPIAAWSRQLGVRRETVFRHFRAAYGVAPSRYRLEARARRAWRELIGADHSLAEVALAAGFADHAHMSRAVRMLTGRTPSDWRRQRRLQHSFKTKAR